MMAYISDDSNKRRTFSWQGYITKELKGVTLGNLSDWEELKLRLKRLKADDKATDYRISISLAETGKMLKKMEDDS